MKRKKRYRSAKSETTLAKAMGPLSLQSKGEIGPSVAMPWGNLFAMITQG